MPLNSSLLDILGPPAAPAAPTPSRPAGVKKKGSASSSNEKAKAAPTPNKYGLVPKANSTSATGNGSAKSAGAATHNAASSSSPSIPPQAHASRPAIAPAAATGDVSSSSSPVKMTAAQPTKRAITTTSASNNAASSSSPTDPPAVHNTKPATSPSTGRSPPRGIRTLVGGKFIASSSSYAAQQQQQTRSQGNSTASASASGLQRSVQSPPPCHKSDQAVPSSINNSGKDPSSQASASINSSAPSRLDNNTHASSSASSPSNLAAAGTHPFGRLWTSADDDVLLACVQRHGQKWTEIHSSFNSSASAPRSISALANRNRELHDRGRAPPSQSQATSVSGMALSSNNSNTAAGPSTTPSSHAASPSAPARKRQNSWSDEELDILRRGMARHPSFLVTWADYRAAIPPPRRRSRSAVQSKWLQLTGSEGAGGSLRPEEEGEKEGGDGEREEGEVVQEREDGATSTPPAGITAAEVPSYSTKDTEQQHHADAQAQDEAVHKSVTPSVPTPAFIAPPTAAALPLDHGASLPPSTAQPPLTNEDIDMAPTSPAPPATLPAGPQAATSQPEALDARLKAQQQDAQQPQPSRNLVDGGTSTASSSSSSAQHLSAQPAPIRQPSTLDLAGPLDDQHDFSSSTAGPGQQLGVADGAPPPDHASRSTQAPSVPHPGPPPIPPWASQGAGASFTTNAAKGDSHKEALAAYASSPSSGSGSDMDLETPSPPPKVSAAPTTPPGSSLVGEPEPKRKDGWRERELQVLQRGLDVGKDVEDGSGSQGLDSEEGEQRDEMSGTADTSALAHGSNLSVRASTYSTEGSKPPRHRDEGQATALLASMVRSSGGPKVWPPTAAATPSLSLADSSHPSQRQSRPAEEHSTTAPTLTASSAEAGSNNGDGQGKQLAAELDDDSALNVSASATAQMASSGQLADHRPDSLHRDSSLSSLFDLEDGGDRPAAPAEEENARRQADEDDTRPLDHPAHSSSSRRGIVPASVDLWTAHDDSLLVNLVLPRRSGRVPWIDIQQRFNRKSDKDRSIRALETRWRTLQGKNSKNPPPVGPAAAAAAAAAAVEEGERVGGSIAISPQAKASTSLPVASSPQRKAKPQQQQQQQQWTTAEVKFLRQSLGRHPGIPDSYPEIYLEFFGEFPTSGHTRGALRLKCDSMVGLAGRREDYMDTDTEGSEESESESSESESDGGSGVGMESWRVAGTKRGAQPSSVRKRRPAAKVQRMNDDIGEDMALGGQASVPSSWNHAAAHGPPSPFHHPLLALSVAVGVHYQPNGVLITGVFPGLEVKVYSRTCIRIAIGQDTTADHDQPPAFHLKVLDDQSVQAVVAPPTATIGVKLVPREREQGLALGGAGGDANGGGEWATLSSCTGPCGYKVLLRS